MGGDFHGEVVDVPFHEPDVKQAVFHMAHDIRRIPRLTFDFDLMVPHLEIVQHLRQHEVGQRSGCADADLARQFVTRHQREHILELVIQRGQPFFEQPPLVIEPDAPAHAIEQRNPPSSASKSRSALETAACDMNSLAAASRMFGVLAKAKKSFQIPKRHEPLLSAVGCLRQTATPFFRGNGSVMRRQPYCNATYGRCSFFPCLFRQGYAVEECLDVSLKEAPYMPSRASFRNMFMQHH